MDAQWLAAEAQTLHGIFSNVFYLMVTTFFIIAVVLEYFKLPLGQLPQTPQLVGRVFIACLLMVATPEIMNWLAQLTDGITSEIGKLNEFHHVLDRLSQKLGDLSWSWVSVKDTVTIALSYLSFFVLYITVYLADALFLFCWMLIYVMSPVLIALFVFPLTSGATKTLYRSMIEVCSWKIIWCTLSALLWSMALSDINKPEYNVNFLTVILLNIMLALSIVVTPKITSSFLSQGISNMASSLGDGILAVATLSPQALLERGKQPLARGGRAATRGAGSLMAKGSQAGVRAARRFHRSQRTK